MTLWSGTERRQAEAIVKLATVNPFAPERLEAERAVLGDRYREFQQVWSAQDDLPEESPNVREIATLAEALAGKAVDRAGRGAADRELELFRVLSLYAAYERSQVRFRKSAPTVHRGGRQPNWRRLYESFLEDSRSLMELPGSASANLPAPSHLFAFFFQVHRAFQNIFYCLVGRSLAVARLRAAVWESVFTHDILRYLAGLYERMDDLNTLVTGPSGTGKELVAQAIGLSRYLPYHVETGRFSADAVPSFHPVNLAALTAPLIESELFGHRRGAFTGALEHRAGWFAVCGRWGTVLLDEIGEVEPSIQVKLLRVLESRSFVRLGGRRPQPFEGKVVAATNRDLAVAMREGRFREDLYYRLCADVISTPSLKEQLEGDPFELEHLVAHIVTNVTGGDAPDLVASVIDWIDHRLGRHYDWPGNFRELEQCVRNILIRGEYHPPGHGGGDSLAMLFDAAADARLTSDDLLRSYIRTVHARTKSYSETARRVGLDRRTVKKKLEG